MRNFTKLVGRVLRLWAVGVAVSGAAAHAATAPTISSASWLVLDGDTGQVLAEYNADQRRDPASLTKLLTAYVVFVALRRNNLSWDESVTVSASEISSVVRLENTTKPQGRMETHITDIAHVIQLSVAPVFLLTAISTLIGAMNTRLGRIIDRRRVVTEIHTNKETTPADAEELLLLARRRHLIYLAILFAVMAALLVCFVVAGAFLGALVAADLTRLVAALFILAMGSMIAALSLFLREIYLAVSAGSR